ncbi:MAG: YkgJ family cysteine cluster protein [bacterium]
MTEPGGGGQGDPEDILARYHDLVAKVDDFWSRARRAQPDHFRCRDGCDDCCRQQLTVFPVEATAIRAFLRVLDPGLRRTLAERAGGIDPTPPSCVFLTERHCAIYPVRPLICRSHGLPVRVDGRLDWCPLNFTHGEPVDASVLELDRINTMLALVDRLHADAMGSAPDRDRIALRELALDPECAGSG